jgi:uncharacterized membrane protein
VCQGGASSTCIVPLYLSGSWQLVWWQRRRRKGAGMAMLCQPPAWQCHVAVLAALGNMASLAAGPCSSVHVCSADHGSCTY